MSMQAAIDCSGTWLAFELAGQRFAVPATNVREVVQPMQPTPVPGAPADVVGIVNLHGAIVTVLDGCIRLGLDGDQRRAGPRTRLVIFEGTDEGIGMRVDALGDTWELDEGEPTAPAAGSAHADGPVCGTLHRGGRCIALLDAGTLCRVLTSATEVHA